MLLFFFLGQQDTLLSKWDIALSCTQARKTQAIREAGEKKIRGLTCVKCEVTLTEKSICQYSSMGQDYAVTNLHGIASLPQGVAEV